MSGISGGVPRDLFQPPEHGNIDEPADLVLSQYGHDYQSARGRKRGGNNGCNVVGCGSD